MVMKLTVVLCFHIHLLTIAFSQSFDEIRPQEPIETSTRPQMSPLLRELSRLLVNFDEVFYRVTAPKVELEQNIEEEKVRNMPDPIRSYFDRVRENYRSIQSRLGSTLDESEGNFNIPSLFDINFRNKGSKSAVGVSLPFLPLNIQVNAKSAVSRQPISSDKIEMKPTPDILNEVKISNSEVDSTKNKENDLEIQMEESLNEDSNKPLGEFQKRSSKRPNLPTQIPNDSNLGQKNRDLKTKPTKKVNQHLKILSSGQENKPFGTDLGIRGRILGDLLYSESTFDRYFRSLLKNFKWLVDPSAFPPKEVVENIRGITAGQFSAVSKQTDNQNDAFASNIRKKSSGSKPGNQNIEIRDAKPIKHQTPHVDSGRDRNSKIILAFTPEGVPLKLKIDSGSKSSLTFLHEALSTAGLSLYLPIESQQYIKPVGSDILLLGSAPRGMEVQALYVDITDDKQLKSFLKNLKKIKTNI